MQVFVENAVAALPHDAHFMGIILTAINALSTGHPEQNPALAGQDIYKSKEIQDKQIVRLIGDPPPPPPPPPVVVPYLRQKTQNRLAGWQVDSDSICPRGSSVE